MVKEKIRYKSLTKQEVKTVNEYYRKIKKKKSKKIKENSVKKKAKKSKKNKSKYRDFLKTPYWKSVRLRVFYRDNYKCVCCHSDNTIQAHHLTYKHHKQEHLHLTDLITLCESCHKKEHKIK